MERKLSIYVMWYILHECIHRFEEGAEQFRIDVAANPNDTEESIWCFLCEAQLYGIEEARKRFLEASSLGCTSWSAIFSSSSSSIWHAFTFFQVGVDSRPVMREAYALFRDGGDPEKVISAEIPMSMCSLCCITSFWIFLIFPVVLFFLRVWALVSCKLFEWLWWWGLLFFTICWTLLRISGME